jgi:hypothetical protein
MATKLQQVIALANGNRRTQAFELDNLPVIDGVIARLDPVEAARFNTAMADWKLRFEVRLNELLSIPEQFTSIFNGIEYRQLGNGQHLVRVNLAAEGISFAITGPGGTRDTVKQTTKDFLDSQQAQLAINCHFFLPTTSDVNANIVGFGASAGTILSPFEPQPVAAGFPDQSYAIIPFAPALNLSAENTPSIIYQGSESSAFNAVSGSAQIITEGSKTIPEYGTGELNELEGFSDSFSWYKHEVRGRNCIGFTNDRQTLIILVIDDDPGSTVEAAADTMLELGAYNALNLDGGTSAALAIRDASGSRYLNDATNRAVGSNLAIFANAI